MVATWDGEPGASPREVLEGLRSGGHPPAREEFEEEGPEPTLRWALLLDEADDEPGDAPHGLYGYVLADEEWLQVAVLFEDASDVDEALYIWRSVRHSPPAP